MKVIKGKEHSLLARPFGLRGRQYLTLSVMLFFDLTAPESLLTEQELWQVVSKELGMVPFEIGFPKTRGEALLAGACHAPRNTRLQASSVSMAVGPLRKRLNVFGQRYWKKAAGVDYITEPLPFESMPLTWEKAFGGEKYAKNPQGRGLDTVQDKDGRAVRPLPCVELPGKLVGDISDKPDPAGFMPLEVTWPQRSKYVGTYDKKWQQEVMPDLPEDFDPLFFNAAPLDQQLKEGYFQGGEDVYLENMHPDEGRIRSRLPSFRVRCFLMRERAKERTQEKEQVFQDVGMNLDTVWFLPGALRGALVYRGVSEVADDEYSDVLDVFVAHEPLSEAPKSTVHYRQERDKALQRKVEIDPAPLEKAQQKAERALQRARLMPKDLQKLKQKLQGKAPRMPRQSSETHAAVNAMLTKRLAGLDSMESMTTSMRGRFGPGMPGGVEGKFPGMRENILKAQKRVDKMLQGSLARQKKAAANAAKCRDMVKESFSPEFLQEAGVDPDSVLEPKKKAPWLEQGFPFVVACRKRLQNDAQARRELQRLGFEWRSLKRHWVGLNDALREDRPALWGLAEAEGPVRLPPGLVLPRFKDADLARVRIREGAFDPDTPSLEDASKDLLVPGSDKEPLFLAPPSPLDEQGAPVLIVPDELQAILAEQEAGDLCGVLALTSPAEKPGEEGAKALEQAKAVLVLLPAGRDVRTSMELWHKTFKDAGPLVLPRGKTLMEAHRLGERLRPWFLAALPREISEGQGEAVTLPEKDKAPTKPPVAGIKPPALDVKGFVATARQEAQQAMQAGRPSFDKMKEDFFSTARDAFKNQGLDPEKILRPPSPDSLKLDSSGFAAEAAKQALGMAASLKDLGKDDQAADLRAKAEDIKALDAKLQALRAKSAALRAEGKAKLAKVKAGEKPEKITQSFERTGVDPEDLKRLTREEVLERLERGQGLRRCDISGLDLGGLRMRGVDFRESKCRKTKFVKADLEAADFSQAQLMEADFSEATLFRARLHKAVCGKAVFNKAFLRGANLSQADLSKANLVEAELCEAELERVHLAKARARNADFSGCRATMSIFSEVDFSGAIFDKASLYRCLLHKCVLDGVCFRQTTCERTMFQACHGAKVSFHQANLDHVRMIDQTRFPEADFNWVSMRQAFCKQSTFTGAWFAGAVLEEAMFESCIMTNCTLRSVSAKFSRFPKTDLELANLSGSNLFLSSMRKARLVEADLSACNLFGVDFFKAVLGDTNFRASNLKRTLLWNRKDLID